MMQQITIPLDDQSASRLLELAQQRGETPEQTAQALLLATLPAGSAAPQSSPTGANDPDGSKAILALSGIIHFPGVTGPVNTTNEDIDRMLAGEAMNPHADE